MKHIKTRPSTSARTCLALGLFAAMLATSHAARADDQDLRQQIVGSWSVDPGCDRGHVTFRGDGSLEFVGGGGTSNPVGVGSYTINNGVLTIMGGTVRGTGPVEITQSKMTGIGWTGWTTGDLVRCNAAPGPTR